MLEDGIKSEVDLFRSCFQCTKEQGQGESLVCKEGCAMGGSCEGVEGHGWISKDKVF